MATEKLKRMFSSHLATAAVSDRFLLTDGNAQAAIAASDMVLLASGTASLQAALLAKPMVAAYRLAPLTYAIAKVFKLVKVPYFSLPNLITEEALVPEFIQSAANPHSLADAVAALLDDPQRRVMIAAEFDVLRRALAQGADQRAATAVLELALQ
jgi:lipid-A-disaccharide synthase